MTDNFTYFCLLNMATEIWIDKPDLTDMHETLHSPWYILFSRAQGTYKKMNIYWAIRNGWIISKDWNNAGIIIIIIIIRDCNGMTTYVPSKFTLHVEMILGGTDSGGGRSGGDGLPCWEDREKQAV